MKIPITMKLPKAVSDYFEQHRNEGTIEEGIIKLLDKLLEQKEEQGISREEELYDVVKEIFLLPPQEKLSLFRELSWRLLSSDVKPLIPQRLSKLVASMTEVLVSNSDIKVLNSFSGMGSLLDSFADELSNADIDSQEVNSKHADIQEKLFDLCEMNNIKVKNENSLEAENQKEKYDLVISAPPFSTDKLELDEVNLEGFQSNEFDKDDFNKLTYGEAFILKGLNSIKSDGTMVGILSPKILFARKQKRIRDLILEEARVLGVVELPKNVFSSASVNPVIVILQKKAADKNYSPEEVFMASLNQSEFNSSNFDQIQEDLLSEWESFVEEEVNHAN